MPHNPLASDMRTLRVPLLVAGAALSFSTIAGAQLSAPLDSAAMAAFKWRSIGPANMSGRVTDIEVDPRNSKVFYVATAAGGIWKTVNAGTMFFPLFDQERVVSLGDIAIAPSNGDIIYAGTGEEDSRNSISPGGGIYKSMDAGKTWKLMGLEKTQTSDASSSIRQTIRTSSTSRRSVRPGRTIPREGCTRAPTAE